MKEMQSAVDTTRSNTLIDQFAVLKKQSITYRLIALSPIMAVILLPAFGYNIQRPIAIAILVLPAVVVLFNLLIKMDKKIDILFELIVSQQKNIESKIDGTNKQS